jgi:NADPH-dependent 7-cyano-7-deazaguanine reductase QueF
MTVKRIIDKLGELETTTLAEGLAVIGMSVPAQAEIEDPEHEFTEAEIELACLLTAAPDFLQGVVVGYLLAKDEA